MGPFLGKPMTEKTSHTESGDSLSYAVSAMQGWRRNMEDEHTTLLSLEKPFESWSFFGVYDGHSSGIVSDLCSKKLLECIMHTDEFKTMKLDSSGDPVNLDTVKSGVKKGFLDMDVLVESTIQLGDNSGSTVTVVFITPKYFIFANCGDSRGILIRNNAVHFFTEDHKPDKPVELARIEKAGGDVVNQRIYGSLAVSRSIGDRNHKRDTKLNRTEQIVSPEPDVMVIERKISEDQVVVLACDGIWDVITNDELCEYLPHRFQRVSDLSQIAEEVIDNCLYKGSKDNMSLILITTKNVEKFNQQLADKDAELNARMVDMVNKYVENDEGKLDKASLLAMFEQASLPDLPPGGLSAKRCVIDKLFEELVAEKTKPPPEPERPKRPQMTEEELKEHVDYVEKLMRNVYNTEYREREKIANITGQPKKAPPPKPKEKDPMDYFFRHRDLDEDLGILEEDKKISNVALSRFLLKDEPYVLDHIIELQLIAAALYRTNSTEEEALKLVKKFHQIWNMKVLSKTENIIKGQAVKAFLQKSDLSKLTPQEIEYLKQIRQFWMYNVERHVLENRTVKDELTNIIKDMPE